MVSIGTKQLTNVKVLFLVLVIYVLGGECGGSIKDCISAAIRLGRPGNGTTPVSCFSCDPARPVCSKGCQQRIDNLYYDCDGVSLPDGYYYDVNAGNFLTGGWGKVKPTIKIAVERCGCDSAAALSLLAPVVIVALAAVFNSL